MALLGQNGSSAITPASADGGVSLHRSVRQIYLGA
jgi:hypothetical protein